MLSTVPYFLLQKLFSLSLQSALRQITDKAREFGADALFNQILPLLMSPTLEDQERHLLVKVIDRVLYKLDDLVRPYVHKVNQIPLEFSELGNIYFSHQDIVGHV